MLKVDSANARVNNTIRYFLWVKRFYVRRNRANPTR